MIKQTAVEWLQEQLFPKRLTQEQYYCIEKAKEMEKEQIVDAFGEGNKYNGWALKHEPEQYYNETYKKEDK